MRAPGVVAAVIGIVVVACESFTDAPGSTGGDAGIDSTANDGAGASCTESCGERTECKVYDFQTSCAEWTTSGDATATPECSGGKLRVQAEDTLDAQATLTLPTPSTAYSLRLAWRLAISRWDGGRVLALGFGETPFGILNAEQTALSKKIVMSFCRSAECSALETLSFDPGSEHQWLLEITASETKLTVDCVPVLSLAGVAPPLKAQLGIVFGKVNGNPIEATLDDVVVAYE